MGHSGVVQMIKDTPHSAIDSWRGGGRGVGGWGGYTAEVYTTKQTAPSIWGWLVFGRARAPRGGVRSATPNSAIEREVGRDTVVVDVTR